MSRHTRAAFTAAAAGAAYYAAAALGSRRPVRLGALFILACGALAGTVVQGSRASAKAYEVESRLNQFFGNGGQVGGDLVVNGNHTVTGSHTVQGQSHLQGVNDNADWIPHHSLVIGASGAIFMNGRDIWMQGGTIHP